MHEKKEPENQRPTCCLNNRKDVYGQHTRKNHRIGSPHAAFGPYRYRPRSLNGFIPGVDSPWLNPYPLPRPPYKSPAPQWWGASISF